MSDMSSPYAPRWRLWVAEKLRPSPWQETLCWAAAAGVLGALTADLGYTREQVGKIQVTDFCTFVGIDRSLAQQACDKLNAGKVKGKSVRARLL